jgi:hypothetical protein
MVPSFWWTEPRTELQNGTPNLSMGIVCSPRRCFNSFYRRLFKELRIWVVEFQSREEFLRVSLSTFLDKGVVFCTEAQAGRKAPPSLFRLWRTRRCVFFDFLNGTVGFHDQGGAWARGSFT